MIVLFKNNKRKKIIKSFVRKNVAETFFESKIKISNNVKFNVEVENALDVKYELALLSKKEDNDSILYKQDDLGRNTKIEIIDSDYKIIKIEKYNLPEKIYDWSKNKRITFDDFFSKYFKTKEFKSVFSVNNKIVIQIDEIINIFSLKNIKECERFLFVLKEKMLEEKRSDGLFVKDMNTSHRKYLYEILEKNGIDKKRLYRQSTTFSERK